MNDLDTSVAPLIEAYQRAVLNQDVGAFMQLYDAGVRVFDTWGVWSYEGAGAWRTMVEGWLSSLGDERVTVTFDEVQVIGGPTLCGVSAIVTYASSSPAAEENRAMQNRLTWMLRRESSAWKIVHEHTSAPAGFDDGKAILQREKTA
jgi:ketosteroid isomerase-like protein